MAKAVAAAEVHTANLEAPRRWPCQDSPLEHQIRRTRPTTRRIRPQGKRQLLSHCFSPIHPGSSSHSSHVQKQHLVGITENPFQIPHSMSLTGQGASESSNLELFCN